MIESFLGGRVVVKVGDITEEDVEAIVNAANSTLLGGGGVDGAIHRQGGLEIIEECRHIRETRYPQGLPTGDAVITSGGNLTARYVIHTVGPIYGANDRRDAELLAACYTKCLNLAGAENIASVAFPAISTGVYGYPKDEAAKIASRAIKEAVEAGSPVGEIRLIFYSAAAADEFVRHSSF